MSEGELTGPRYQLDRAMAEEEFRQAARGDVRCSLCSRPAIVILRSVLTEEQCRKLGTDHRATTFAFASLCPVCMQLPDLDARLDEVAERGLTDPGRPIYDLGDLDPPAFLK